MCGTLQVSQRIISSYWKKSTFCVDSLESEAKGGSVQESDTLITETGPWTDMM